MRRLRQNRWSVLAIMLAIAAGLLLGIWVQGATQRAEAVIGGVGNLVVGGTPTNNHPHNFAYNSTGARTSDPTETRICVFCHTPHFAVSDTALLNAPLWNHTLSSGVTYSVKSPGWYSGSPVSGNIFLLATPLSTPDGDSRLCLSCHDGTVSVGNVRSEISASGIPMQQITNVITSGGMIDPNNSAYIGTNLTTKHVVSIPMNQGLITAHNALCGSNGQTTEIHFPWDTGMTNGITIFLRPTTATYGSNPGISGSSITSSEACASWAGCTKNYGSGYNYGIQCSTCHDPHYWAENAGPQTQGYKMLVAGTNTLCSTCHTSCP